MRQATQSKFQKWDRIVSEGWIGGPDKEKETEAYGLLRDPTYYSYAFFKNPDGTPFKLFPYQDVILNDQHRFVQFAAANQIGKSVALRIKALHYAFMNPGHTVLVVSKTLPQSKDLIREMRNILKNSAIDIGETLGETQSKTELYIRHYETRDGKRKELPESRIICVPATGGALGYAVNLALLDELAFFDDGEYFYYQILLPRTYATKGQIICFSNPNGRQGIFWKLWNLDSFHHYKFNFLDCPLNSKEEFDQITKGMSIEQIDSTLLAKFTIPEGGFITVEEREKMQSRRQNAVIEYDAKEPRYVFLDLAKTQDRTIRAIGRPVYDDDGIPYGVYVEEIFEYPQRTPYNEIIDDLVEICQIIPNVQCVGWDSTGVGKAIEDFITRIENYGIACTPVDFNIANKSRIYGILKMLIERNFRGSRIGIDIPYVEECDKQLAKLRFKKSTRGYLQVHHENERDRDDFPDALAGLSGMIIDPENKPVSLRVVNEKTELTEEEEKEINTFEISRHHCGNIIDPGDIRCSNCHEELFADF